MTADMHPKPDPPMSRRSALALVGAAGLGAIAAARERSPVAPLGVYSGVVPLGPSSSAPSTSGTFLRGVQNTGADGSATFKTIYPGWYMGTPHIHVKVLLNDHTVHTGQLFFDDSLTASVYQKNAPYDTRPATDTTNASDNIYQQAVRPRPSWR